MSLLKAKLPSGEIVFAEQGEELRGKNLRCPYCGGQIDHPAFKELMKGAEKAYKEPLKRAKKAMKDSIIDAKRKAADRADETVIRGTEKVTQAMGDAVAPATLGVSAAAGRGAAVMQEAGLQARKAGRAAAAKAEKRMTDNVADKIEQYSKSSGMVLISGELPGIGGKEAVR